MWISVKEHYQIFIMVYKGKFSEIEQGQEFFAVEIYVGNDEMKFIKIEPMPV